MKNKTMNYEEFGEMLDLYINSGQDFDDGKHVKITSTLSNANVQLTNVTINKIHPDNNHQEHLFLKRTKLTLRGCNFNQDSLTLFNLLEINAEGCAFNCPVTLNFVQNAPENKIWFRDCRVTGLSFGRPTQLYECIFDGVDFIELNMERVVAGNAGFIWGNTRVGGELNLSFMKNPHAIHCDWDIREQIHYAAPTIPLVMTKK